MNSTISLVISSLVVLPISHAASARPARFVVKHYCLVELASEIVSVLLVSVHEKNACSDAR